MSRLARQASKAALRERRKAGSSRSVAGLARGDLAVFFAVLALAFGVLGAVGYSRPTTVAGSHATTLREVGQYSYVASVAKNVIYPGRTAGDGEPILLQGAGPVRFSFHYLLVVPAHDTVQGTERLTAAITPGGDIKKELLMGGSVRLRNGAGVVSGSLSPAELVKLATAFGELNAGGGDTTVTVTPNVDFTLSGPGGVVVRHFDPALSFSLTPQMLSLSAPSGTLGAAGPSPQAALRPTGTVTVSSAARVPASLSLVLLHPRVSAVRVLGLSGLVLLGLLALLLGWPLLFGDNPRRKALARYGDILVPVLRADPCGGSEVIVGEIDTLVSLARRFETVVLQVPESLRTTYLVIDGQVTYRYDEGVAGKEGQHRRNEPGASRPAVSPEPSRGAVLDLPAASEDVGGLGVPVTKNGRHSLI